MSIKTLQAKHTVSYKPTPLVCFSNLPGYDAELSPAQIRQLAAVLLTVADDCEALFEHTRWYGPVRRDYPVPRSDMHPNPPQYRIVNQNLTIRFQGADYSVPFAEIGQQLLVAPAAGQPGVFAFPDGWHPDISASAGPSRNLPGTHPVRSTPMPPGSESIACKTQANSHAAGQGAHPATPPAPSRGRRQGKSAWVARAIHLLPLPAEPSAPAQKNRDDKTDSGNRCS